MLTIVHLTAACGPAQQDVEAERSESIGETAENQGTGNCALVVAFGDSLFAGYELGPNEGFVPTLQRELRGEGIDASVHNAAVSGDTSAKGRQRLAFMLEGLERKPDLVLVELGANDMLRGLEPDKTRENLIAILDELQNREIDAMLVGMLSAPNMGADYAEAFNSIYPELATRYDIPLYPFVLDGVLGNPSLMLEDGVHPNQQGVELMVDRMTDDIAGNLPDCDEQGDG